MTFIDLQIATYCITLGLITSDSVMTVLDKSIVICSKFNRFAPEFIVLVGVAGSFYSLSQALMFDSSADSLVASLGVSLNTTLIAFATWVLGKLLYGLRHLKPILHQTRKESSDG